MKLVLAFFLSIIVFTLFSKRKIEGVILLLVIALVKFEILLGSTVVQLYQLISIALLAFIIFYTSAKKVYNKIDRKIFLAVCFYLLGLAFAALVMRTDASMIGRIQMSFDYSILFFITLFCLHNLKDVEKLLKGIHFGIFLVAFIGLTGFAIGNPFLGFEELNVAVYSNDYFQNIQDYNDIGGGNVSIGRVSFSTSDPNSLGILMIFGTAISFFLIKKTTSLKYKLFHNLSVIFFLFTIILTYSRTALIIFIILILEKILRDKKKILVNIVVLFVLIITSVTIATELGYLEALFFRVNDIEQIQDGNGRTQRWIYHFNHLNFEYILFGNSHTGFQGNFSKMSHTNYLALIYRGGFITFLSFIYLLIRLFKSKLSNIIAPFRTLVYIILVSSISQEVVNSYGPNFVIWPIVAVLAFSNQYILKNERKSSRFTNLS